jgi:hypothetical protein
MAKECDKCYDRIDHNGFCWCADNRDPIASLAAHFPSPVCDASDGSMGRVEADILRRLFEAHLRGEESPLVEDRCRCPDRDTYAVSWYWTDRGSEYPRQCDGPIVRLWSRLMIRPVRCAGGYTWVVLSDEAVKRLEPLEGSAT